MVKGGVLEVLLVGAEGFKHITLLGRPCLYAILQCGSDTYNSKITSGKKLRVWWNEKFIFKLPSSEKYTKLSLKILEKDKFTDDNFLGEATIYLGGIIKEGIRNGSGMIRPAPYNIVLPDGKYKGEVKVGLKFTSNEGLMESQTRTREGNQPSKQRQQICRAIFDFASMVRRFSWRWPGLNLFQASEKSTDEEEL